MNPIKDILKWVFPSAELKWLLPLAKLVYRMMAVSAEVLCRHSFGQRYAPQLFGSLLLAFLYAGLISIAMPQRPPRLFGTYLLIFFLMICYHLFRMFRPRAVPLHSFWPGQSWDFWGRYRLRPGLVRLIFEPGLVVLIGFLVLRTDSGLAIWLQISGLCLFIKEFIFQWQHRNRLLDALDARAEGERLNTGIRTHTVPESDGERTATPVVPARPAVPTRNQTGQFVRNLDPALQRLLAAGNQATPNPARPMNTANPQAPRRVQLRRHRTPPRIGHGRLPPIRRGPPPR